MQDETTADAAGDEVDAEGEEPLGEAEADEPAEPSDEAAAQRREERKLRLDPHEEKGRRYLFAGWMLRGMIVPEFLLEAFLGSSPRVTDWATGTELTIRKDNFDIVVGAWWAGYRFNGPVRDKGDPVEDTEWLDSNWSALLTTVSFLWGTEFTDQWALQYGFDVGLAWLVGKLYRTEAYPTADGGYAPCVGPGNPDTIGPNGVPYCDQPSNPIPGSDPPTNQDKEDGAHYYVEQRRWTKGGNAPTFVPWLAVRLAARYKPIKQVMTRAEIGIGLGVYLGLSAAYGF